MPQNTPPQRIASGSIAMLPEMSPMAKAMRENQQGPEAIPKPPKMPQLPTTTPALAAMQNTVFTQAQPVQQELLVNKIQKSAASLAPGMEEAYAALPANKKPGPVEFKSSPSGRPPTPGLLGRGISALNSAADTAYMGITGKPVSGSVDSSKAPAAAATRPPAPSDIPRVLAAMNVNMQGGKPAAKAPANAPALTSQAKAAPAPKPAAQAHKPAPAAAPAKVQAPPPKPAAAQAQAGPTPMGGGMRTPALAALPSSAAAGGPMPPAPGGYTNPSAGIQTARGKLDAMRAQRAAHDASPVGQQYQKLTQKTSAPATIKRKPAAPPRTGKGGKASPAAYLRPTRSASPPISRASDFEEMVPVKKTGSVLPPPGEITKRAFLPILSMLYGGATAPEGRELRGAMGAGLGSALGGLGGMAAGGAAGALPPAIAAAIAGSRDAHPDTVAALLALAGLTGGIGAIGGNLGGTMYGTVKGRDWAAPPRPQEKTSAARSFLDSLDVTAKHAALHALKNS